MKLQHNDMLNFPDGKIDEFEWIRELTAMLMQINGERAAWQYFM